MFARRRFAVLKNFIEYVGIESGRLHFSWISSAEAQKFQKTVNIVVDKVKALGPIKFLVKDSWKVT